MDPTDDRGLAADFAVLGHLNPYGVSWQLLNHRV
jgi:hypothetical protein